MGSQAASRMGNPPRYLGGYARNRPVRQFGRFIAAAQIRQEHQGDPNKNRLLLKSAATLKPGALAVWLAWLMVCLSMSAASPASLTWLESRTEAISAAKSQGKLVLLLAGRPTCGGCNYMRDTVCESPSPPVQALIQARFVPWYCDVDAHAEWKPYALGLGSFTLPMICCIDPNTPSPYLDRTTGLQTAQGFYDRLLAAARSNGPSLQVSLARGVASFMITNLTVGITNQIERSFDPSKPGGWKVVATFVSGATATNWTEVYDGGRPQAFYRVSSLASGQ